MPDVLENGTSEQIQAVYELYDEVLEKIQSTNDEMNNCFKDTVTRLTGKKCDFVILKEPPVMGAILWALELANNELPSEEVKKHVLEQIIEYQKGC